MLDVLKSRDSAKTAQVPSAAVRAGLTDLRKLRPMVDPTARPLLDAWSRFVSAWNDYEQHEASAADVDTQRQSLLDEMSKEQADLDMMQKMLKEGV